jgi:hypothetical protein
MDLWWCGKPYDAFDNGKRSGVTGLNMNEACAHQGQPLSGSQPMSLPSEDVNEGAARVIEETVRQQPNE